MAEQQTIGRRQLILLFLSSLLVLMYANPLVRLLPVYASQMGASPSQVGIYLALVYASLALSTFVAGWLSDRYQRSHSYLGYVLQIDGVIGDEERMFTVGIGRAAQAKHAFRYGDQVTGVCVPAADPQKEPAEFYRASGLKLLSRNPRPDQTPPPWKGVAPDLDEYRKRGHRRLAARTYTAKCPSCIWGCRMSVEITVDHWNPSQRRYRTETFCYGPKSCQV